AGALYQKKAVAIAVEARCLRVGPDPRLAPERGDALRQRLGRPDVAMHEGVRRGSLFLAQLLQAGRDLLEGLRQRFVELGVRRLGSAPQRVTRAFAGGARGVADVIGRNPHRDPPAEGWQWLIRSV